MKSFSPAVNLSFSFRVSSSHGMERPSTPWFITNSNMWKRTADWWGENPQRRKRHAYKRLSSLCCWSKPWSALRKKGKKNSRLYTLLPGLDVTRLFISLTAGAGTRCMEPSLFISNPVISRSFVFWCSRLSSLSTSQNMESRLDRWLADSFHLLGKPLFVPSFPLCIIWSLLRCRKERRTKDHKLEEIQVMEEEGESLTKVSTSVFCCRSSDSWLRSQSNGLMERKVITIDWYSGTCQRLVSQSLSSNGLTNTTGGWERHKELIAESSRMMNDASVTWCLVSKTMLEGESRCIWEDEHNLEHNISFQSLERRLLVSLSSREEAKDISAKTNRTKT